MPLTHRIERIAEQLREEVSQILATEVADPGVGLVTVSRVKVTPDLSLARVYWTLLGDAPSARRRPRRCSGRRRSCAMCWPTRLTLRRVPEVHFQFDEGLAAHTRVEESCTSCTSRKPRAARGDGRARRRRDPRGSDADAADDPTGRRLTRPCPPRFVARPAAARAASSCRRTSDPTATPSGRAWRWCWRCARWAPTRAW